MSLPQHKASWSTDDFNALAEYVSSISGGGTASFTLAVAQTAHGLTLNQQVRCTGVNTWVAAKADVAADADVDGVVTTVTDANNFIVTTTGPVIAGFSALTPGSDYFLDPTTAGSITASEPSTAGQVSAPVLKAISTTQVIYHPQRGLAIPPAAKFRVGVKLKDDATALSVAEDLFQYVVPSWLNGLSLVGVIASVTTASSSGLPGFGIRKNASTEMLSTNVTIDANELSSDTAATPAVIKSDGSQAVATGDVIHFDCDVAGTGAKGAFVELAFS